MPQPKKPAGTPSDEAVHARAGDKLMCGLAQINELPEGHSWAGVRRLLTCPDCKRLVKKTDMP